MKRLRKILKLIGPGFITGASDDDPSGIATYSQTGAIFGYSQLWTALFSFPFMATIQEICGRIGIVTGKGLAVIVRENYAKPVLYIFVFILLIANTINIGADLGAMASAGQLIFNAPFVLWLIIITAIILLLEILVPYPTYARFLKYLTLSLFAYFFVAIIIKQDWLAIGFSTLIPSIKFSKEYLFNIVAILGTTISPYLFFWQADEEVEEEIEHHQIVSMGKGKPHITTKDIKKLRIDTIFGMFFSNLVMWFIIITTASTLSVHGITYIQTADQAAVALKPLAGDFAFLLFALGIIGTGFLAVPILSGSASYALSESLGWKVGLGIKFKKAPKFYLIIVVATVVGLIINFTSIKPFQALYYTAILNGICAPPLLFLIMKASNNKKIMGEQINSTFSNIFGWTITLVMTIAAILLLVSLVI